VFGRSRPVVIESYDSRRARWRAPRWLLLLLVGVVAGVGGTLYVQERHLPPRLSAAESANLRAAFTAADDERTSLRTRLAETSKSLDAALSEGKRLAEELAAADREAARLRDDVDFLVDALPADPRGGVVEIRAAQFRHAGSALDYEIALAQSGRGSSRGRVVELVVTGGGGPSAQTSVTLGPLSVPDAGKAVLRGRAALPDGFSPSQCAIRVLDRPAGQLLGMRLINVR